MIPFALRLMSSFARQTKYLMNANDPHINSQSPHGIRSICTEVFRSFHTPTTIGEAQ